MGKILIIKGADFSAVAVDKAGPIINKVSITVVASPSGGGTTTGSGNYAEGSQVTISATPSSGYSFVQWNDGNTNATRTIIVGSSAKTYTAIFEVSGEMTPIWSNAHGFIYTTDNKWYGHGCAAATGYNVTTGQVVKVSILNNTQYTSTSDPSLIRYRHYAVATKSGTDKPEGNTTGVDIGFIKAYKTLESKTAPTQGSETYTITENGVLVVHHYDDQEVKVELVQ